MQCSLDRNLNQRRKYIILRDSEFANSSRQLEATTLIMNKYGGLHACPILEIIGFKKFL